ncbi:GGDEF domain-containing protein [Thalassiella azotivora]
MDRHAMLADALRPACTVLAVVFAGIAPLHLLTLDGAAGTVVAAVAAVTAVVIAGVGVALRTAGPDSFVHSRGPELALAVACMAVANTLVHLEATGSPYPTANLVAVVIGVGAILSVRAHALAVVVVADVAWFVIALRHGFDETWQQSAGALLAASGLAGVLHVTRYRTVQRLEVARSQLGALSITDELTGVRNRRGLLLAGQPLLQLAHRDGAPVTVVYLDLDGLKGVNDTLGHAAGDRMILATAEVLSATVRSSDVVARLGGDEFAVLLPHAGAAEARALVGRCTERLATVGVSASMGWACDDLAARDGGPPSLDGLLAAADARMYEVKRRRRTTAGRAARPAQA